MSLSIRKTLLVMKLSFILILAGSLQLSASVLLGQQVSIQMRASLVDVLEELNNQTGTYFTYNEKDIDDDIQVELNLESVSLGEVLEEICSQALVRCEIVEDFVIITKKDPVLVIEKEQENKTVNGKVTDDKGVPLPGVTVVIKGTTNGTITDIDGSYSLSQVPGNATLIFSFVGMKTIEIEVENQNVINVALKDDSIGLEEVVAIGYGTQAKKDITGSVSVIKTDKLLATPSASFAGQLQGRAAGLIVGSSGAPGSVSTIRIRGIGSVNDNSPLFVIDGVSTKDQDMSSIDPNDIESIQILKDASSASIYGAQAANGVVIITTKKGTRTGKPKITYSSYYGIQKLTKGYDLLNSNEWMEAEFQMQSNAYSLRGLSTLPTHPQFGTGTFTLPDYLIPTVAFEGDSGTSLEEYDENTNRITRTNKTGTDWFDEITQVAPIQNHHISLTGGTDKGTYALGLNYFEQEGTVKYSYYKRYSIRANSQFNLRPNIRIGENWTFSYADYNNRNSGASSDGAIARAMKTVPFLPVYDIGGNFAGNLALGTGSTSNVYSELYNNRNDENTNIRMLGNLYAEVDFFNDITFRTSFGIDYSNLYSKAMHIYEPYTAGSDPTEFTESTSNNLRWVFSNTLTYKKVLNSIHSFNILIGTESIKDGIGRSLEATRQSYLFEEDTNTWTLDNGDSSTATNSSSFNGEVMFFGLFGRIDYVLADKYMFTGVLRRDGSSRFSQSQRYGYFPAVSLGWRMSEENFMKDYAWIDNLKCRIGYGTTGNSEIPEQYNWANQYSSSVDNSYYDYENSQTGGTAGYYLSTYGNQETKWETSKMLNMGLDLSLFNYGLEVNVDFYIKKTSDMLIQASYSSLAGSASAPYINIGDISNKGFEISLIHRKKISDDLSYELTGNFSIYKNKVTQLSDNDNYAIYNDGDGRIGNINVTKKGQPIGMFYGWNILGFYDNESEVLNYTNSDGETVLPYGVSGTANLNAAEWIGKYIYEDVNGDGEIDGSDMTVIGNPHPDFTTSLNASISYKNFDFSMYWYASVGNDIYRLWKQNADYGVLTGARSKDVLYDSWTTEHHNAKLPILDSEDVVSNAGSHSAYVEDGTFLKLKNLTVGYTLPQSLTRKIDVDNVRLYIQGTNLLTFTKYEGLDPEIGNQTTDSDGDLLKGIDDGFWPAARQIIVGVSLSF